MNTSAKETSPEIREEIETTLRLLGLNNSYKGFDYLIYGVQLAMESPNVLSYICKGLYMEIALKFGTTGSCVERNIRTVRKAVWRNGSETLRIRIFGEAYMDSQPGNTEFIDALVHYIWKQIQ